jgi:hypothetical protein
MSITYDADDINPKYKILAGNPMLGSNPLRCKAAEDSFQLLMGARSPF